MATDLEPRVSGPISNNYVYKSKNDIYPSNKLNGLKKDVELNVDGKCYFTSFSNRTISPKDHTTENVKRMREIQRASRQRQEASKQHRGPIKSTSRPSSCVSNCGGDMERNTTHGLDNHSPETIRPGTDNGGKQGQSTNRKLVSRIAISSADMSNPAISNRDYLRAHEKTGPPLDITESQLLMSRKPTSDVKISVPRASTAREVQLIRRGVDFVRANAYAAKSARMRRSPSADSLMMTQNQEEEKRKQYRRGEMPSYLVRRQKQLHDDEEFASANEPDPDQPDGHRKLSEKERKSTLELLKATEKNMLTELGRLPIRSDTMKMRTIKQEIERKLNELEEAIKIFSKPKVFVLIDT